MFSLTVHRRYYNRFIRIFSKSQGIGNLDPPNTPNCKTNRAGGDYRYK